MVAKVVLDVSSELDPGAVPKLTALFDSFESMKYICQ